MSDRPSALTRPVTGPTRCLRLDVTVRRGTVAESRHHVQAVVCDAAGAPLAATEGAGRVTTFRSAAKPFQMLPLVERGYADRLGLGDDHLAVIAASHVGGAEHVRLVTEILDRIGLTAHALECGYHEPMDPESRRALRLDSARESPIYNNCSGKHAGMLCLARCEGWPTEGYVRADHPVQRLMREIVADACGMAPGELEVAIDGCSVSVFGLPLSGMARAYARLASARGDASEPRERALARIRHAMQRYPWATGGVGRFGTRLMEQCGPTVVAKGGAEGLECLGLPERGLGVAIKCEDGSERAVAPALIAVLARLELLEPELLARLADAARPVLRNHAGVEVGVIEAQAVVELDARREAPLGTPLEPSAG